MCKGIIDALEKHGPLTAKEVTRKVYDWETARNQSAVNVVRRKMIRKHGLYEDDSGRWHLGE